MLHVDDRPTRRPQGKAGVPPIERQCQALRYKTVNESGERVRCARWARPGYLLCAYHLDRRQRHGHRRHGVPNATRSNVMPVAYKRLSDTLQKRLAAMADKTPAEQLMLTEELQLARATIDDAAEFYDIALLAGEMATQPKQHEDAMRARLAAGQLLRSVVAEVGDIAQQAAICMKESKAFVGVQDVSLLVGQMVEIVRDELGDDRIEDAARIADRLRKIRLPSTGPQGTDLTPDMDAAAMDETVPRLAQVDEEEDAA